MRATRALERRTGYTEPVVDYALDQLFGGIDESTLEATIASELGTLDALDGFVARPGRPDVFYKGLSNVAIVSSDTTIGVAIPALVFALCAKSRVLVKDRDDRLVAAFAETLAEEAPELRDRLETQVWAGADETASRGQLGTADAVLAYGNAEALLAIRVQLRPEARFIPFGHRTSIGYVTREALTAESTAREAARAAALDALLYDGEGCLSVHALFVEREAPLSAATFAQFVAAACDEVAIEFPAGYGAADADVTAYLRRARFRVAQGAGAVFAGGIAPHVVVLDPPHDEPPPLLRRTLALYSVDGAHDALAFVRRYALPLEALGVAGEARTDVEALFHASGAVRLAPLGRLQAPPLGAEHGGYGRILPFVRAMYRG